MAWRDGCNVWWPGGSGVLPVSLPGQAVVGVHEVGEDGLDGTVDGLETKKTKMSTRTILSCGSPAALANSMIFLQKASVLFLSMWLGDHQF